MVVGRPADVHGGGSAVEDLKEILLLGWPNSVNQFAEFIPGFVMLAFLGSDTEHLAAAGMGFMFVNVSGMAFISGSCAGACGLVSQAFGAGNWKRCGDLLQRQLAIHVVVIVLVALVWMNTESILLWVQQPAQVARLTAEFVLWRVPALPFVALRDDTKIFLLAQNLMYTPMVIGLISNVAGIAMAPILIERFGFKGAPAALTISNILQAILTFWASPCVLPHKEAWPTWSIASALSSWDEMLRVSVPAGALMLSEWMGWETMLFFAGLLCPGAQGCVELDVFPIVSNTMVVAFMTHYGFSLAAGTRVGNALGAGDHMTARRTSNITILLAAAVSGVIAVVLVAVRREWGRLFSTDPAVVDLTAKVLPLIAGYIFLDALGPSALISLMRSMGVVRLPAVMGVVAFYVVGIPLGLWLTFVRKDEGWGIIGLWTGLDVGMFVMVVSLLVFQLCVVNWPQVASDARAMAQDKPAQEDDMHEVVAAAEAKVLGKPALAEASENGCLKLPGGAVKQLKLGRNDVTQDRRRTPASGRHTPGSYEKVLSEESNILAADDWNVQATASDALADDPKATMELETDVCR